MIEFAVLRFVPERLDRCPRVLDVACVMVFLRQLLALVPGVETHGVHASEDMLVQARMTLKGQLHVRVERAQIGTGETAGLPYTTEAQLSR